ncbi:kinase-like protein [Rhizodiscina lignyota]|uniref:non-specific serine/threonine protein kinase n=1 Tax=Rhizodiscina lignyota TaxID=1504668 RepID=A0A9P4I8P8_9PEZI|nr:kinase-like protein [Rhizodiscina lignyota]
MAGPNDSIMNWPGAVSGFYGSFGNTPRVTTHDSPTPPYSQSNQQRGDGIELIYKQLLDAKKDPNNKYCKPFIVQDDLNRIWGDPRNVARVIGSGWADQEVDVIRSFMKKILSILVVVDARDCLRDFHRNMYPSNSSGPVLTDADLPIEEHDRLDFLTPQKRDQFIEQQYMFIPYVIEEYATPETHKVDSRRRLPFESIKKNIGVGGYGKVDEVRIPRGYLKSKRIGFSEGPNLVACKRIKIKDEFDKEVQNVEMLKESLTRHDHIMLHFATITHNQVHYILLPFAEHLDLGIFLRCGISDENKRVYMFPDKFPELTDSCKSNSVRVTDHLLRQCWSLADALRWLHETITVSTSPEPLYCAHMDLKPANVLIEGPTDSQTPVGHWKLSDFGISVFREQSKQQDTKFVSPLDYFNQLTLKTRPKRVEGSYTAPEVCDNQKTVGRRSDVWSFGCLFSEVLLFALGRHTLVNEFRNVRKGHIGTDSFYRRKVSRNLAAPDARSEYEIRPWIITWLAGIPVRYSHDSSWMTSGVDGILRMLDPDTATRPTGKQAMEMTFHIRQHFLGHHSVTGCVCRSFTEGGLHPGRAPHLAGGSPPSRSTSETQVPSINSDCRTYNSAPSAPTIKRIDTLSEETIFQGPTPLQIPISRQKSPSASPTSGTTSINAAVTSLTSSPQPSRLSLSTLNMPPSAHGIQPIGGKPFPNRGSCTFSLEVERRGQLIELSKVGTATDIFMSESWIACLVNNVVYRFSLDRVGKRASELRPPIELRKDCKWEHIAMAGPFLVIRGRLKGKKQIMFCRVDLGHSFSGPEHEQIASLQHFGLSPQGAVAFVCDDVILFTHVERFSEGYQERLSLRPNRSFASAAFNDAGDLLYAWSFGQGNDELLVWRIESGTTLSQNPVMKQSYAKIGGDPGARIFPYNTQLGAIIEAPSDRFFPSRLRLKEERQAASKTITRVLTACMFNDHSLITLELDSVGRHPKLKEYNITYGTSHGIGKTAMSAEVLHSLKTRPKQNSPVAMTVTEVNDIISLVTCTDKGEIEMVEFGPS